MQFTTMSYQLADSGLCSQQPAHHRTVLLENIDGEICGGARLPGIVFDNGMGFPIIPTRVAEILATARLTGYMLAPVSVTENQSECDFDPQLFALCFAGKKCERIRIVEGGVNLCIQCNNCPIVCQKCGFVFYVCPNCGVNFTSNRPVENCDVREESIVVDGVTYAPQDILDGDNYDGSDFVGGGIGDQYISRNALEWCVRNKIAPIRATPVLLSYFRDTTNGPTNGKRSPTTG
ncbi:MAG: hypothetical protein NT069_18345 [Planctomycetota bacterium]|nr:hypothetical protein [Planctomycetota bacterium]